MILIVDDKSENVISLQKTLEYNGFRVDTAYSGEEALRKVLKNDYSLIILDVQMPDMDGFEVAESILGSSKSKDIPIIFLSAVSTDKRFITKGYASGAVDYLTKPVDVDILLLKTKILSLLGEQTQRLKKTQAELKEKNQQLFVTLQSLPQIAYSATAYGSIEYVNIKWYEFAPDEQTWPQGICEGYEISELWPKLIRTQEPFEKEVLIKNIKDNKYRYHIWKVVPVRSDHHTHNWVGTFTDIHEQKQTNEVLEIKVKERTQQLLNKNKELEEINQEMQQFTTVASHDLKEPLRKVQTFIDLIGHKKLGGDNEELNKYLHKINESSRRMMILLDSLLQYSRLSARELYALTDLNSTISDVLDDLEVSIKEKKAFVSVDKMPQIICIPGQVRQVFQNIISNSLKFSRTAVPPEIIITHAIIDICPEIDATLNPGPYCKITINDNGIGFNEKFQDKIYVLFQRLNTKSQYEGTGIGLAVTKKIIDNHGGSIAATSHEGVGTSFMIVLSLNGPLLN
jgi:signal transduction histidine kinase/FixJ family two-component response regulator